MLSFNKIKKRVKIRGINRVIGSVRVDGDKSISHRAVIFSSLAKGKGIVKNCLFSDDVLSTINCFRKTGIKIYRGKDSLEITGRGLSGLRKPSGALDAGNSGTTMRLLSGVLAGQEFNSIIKGDPSLSKRPMARVVEPLRKMGAEISGRRKSGKILPPLKIKGRYPLRSISWCSKIASAQVKSAILLAGLYAEGGVTVKEPGPSRDHTERMMKYFGLRVKNRGGIVRSGSSSEFKPRNIDVPGDVSSASFYIALAVMLKGSALTVKGVGLNDTRTGFIKLLKKMGACVEFRVTGSSCGEPVGYIKACFSELKAVPVDKKQIPGLVDEIPLIAVVATQARGRTVISGAGELRVKESDRLDNICTQLKKMGADIRQTADGLIINGPTDLKPARMESFGDHRIAMSLACASLTVEGKSVIKGYDSVKISCPSFWDILRKISRN